MCVNFSIKLINCDYECFIHIAVYLIMNETYIILTEKVTYLLAPVTPRVVMKIVSNDYIHLLYWLTLMILHMNR